MRESIIEILTRNDVFAAFEYLNRQDEPVAIMKCYADLVNHYYWQRKQIGLVVSFAIAGLQYGITSAAAQAEIAPVLATEIKGAAKALAYDLASFTWAGWDEPGIEIGKTDLVIGLEAAKTNLRLAIELGRGDLPLARACWILGAHYLASGNHVQAKHFFLQCANHAGAAPADTEVLLARGFTIITDILNEPENEKYQDALIAIKAQLAALPDGQAFISQITTALAVFTNLR